MADRTGMARSARADRVDALRGVAIVWMVLYHFSFDLHYLGLALHGHNFYADGLWTGQRTGIVTSFLLCAGLGQALAEAGGQGWPRFWRRWAQVAGCALLVSLATLAVFPRSWISFGVLHGIAAMLLMSRLVAPRLGIAGLWALGAAALALPALWQHPWFDTRWTNWTGLVTRKPVTEDFVPVLPWWGVMLWGLALGRTLIGRAPALVHGAVPAVARPLAWLGRWSLSVYMVHQPLFIGALLLYTQFGRR